MAGENEVVSESNRLPERIELRRRPWKCLVALVFLLFPLLSGVFLVFLFAGELDEPRIRKELMIGSGLLIMAQIIVVLAFASSFNRIFTKQPVAMTLDKDGLVFDTVAPGYKIPWKNVYFARPFLGGMLFGTFMMLIDRNEKLVFSSWDWNWFRNFVKPFFCFRVYFPRIYDTSAYELRRLVNAYRKQAGAQPPRRTVIEEAPYWAAAGDD